MNTLTFRDIERLSAFLDGQLPQANTTRLESRLKAEPDLAAALDELHQTRAFLRRTPRRRVPRNFILTPKMAGIRPPVPRAVPAFSWASAIAMLLFVCTLGTNLVGRFSFGAAAPMMASAPQGIGGGPAEEAMTDSIPSAQGANALLTATPETYALTVPEATASADERIVEPPTDTTQEKSDQEVDPWLLLLPGLAVFFLGAAVFIGWRNRQMFKKRLNKK